MVQAATIQPDPSSGTQCEDDDNTSSLESVQLPEGFVEKLLVELRAQREAETKRDDNRTRVDLKRAEVIW